MKKPASQRHLHLDYGPLHVDYQGPDKQIAQVAEELAANGRCRVRVDDEVHPDQIPLPYARLWDHPYSRILPPSQGTAPAPIHTITDEGIIMSTKVIGNSSKTVPIPESVGVPEPDPDRARLIGDRATVYREQFGLGTIRTRNGATLAILVGRTVGLMMSRTLAQQVRRVLGRECGPVFTDSGDTSVFLTNSPAADIGIPELTLELFQIYGVMALAQPGLLIPLPTPGTPGRSWINPLRDNRLPAFSHVVSALATVTKGGPKVTYNDSPAAWAGFVRNRGDRR
ncbi:hypothetical protein ABIA39_000298 [Nocardia sp. GAS34]|uniref:hypothetical protein n=1 Tax=unclassified Nocardia TaxID=2637762 RepID=UPI003D19186E